MLLSSLQILKKFKPIYWVIISKIKFYRNIQYLIDFTVTVLMQKLILKQLFFYKKKPIRLSFCNIAIVIVEDFENDMHTN